MTVTLKAGTALPDGSKLIADLSLDLPTLHFGIMGPPSSGKTHLVASMEKPLLVLAADPFDKMAPYFDRGVLDPKVYAGQFGQPIRLVKSATTGKAIIQIEGFHDTNPDAPAAFDALLKRAAQVRDEVIAGQWRSVALDSWSNIEYVAKERRRIGPLAVQGTDSRRGLRIAANAKDDLLTMFNSRFVHLPCHLGVVLHTVEKRDEDGALVYRGMKVIGELKTDLPGSLGERYLARNIDGVRRQLDTRNVGYNCCTLIDAPSPCDNDFKALFTNWITKRAVAANAAAAQPAAADAAPQEGEAK